MFYEQKRFYDFDNPGNDKGGGFSTAFTQIVWKSTTDFGIGQVLQGKKQVVAIYYFPGGNIHNLYEHQVEDIQ